MKSYGDFLNQLDTVFKRDDVRGIWGPELDGEFAWHLGKAFAMFITSQPDVAKRPCIVVGRDMRESSPTIAVELIEGIKAGGADVEYLGMCGTELVYFVAGEHPDRFRAGAMVTASHNPSEYGGIKFVLAGARPLSATQLATLKTETARAYAATLHRALMGPQAEPFRGEFVDKLFHVTHAIEENTEHLPLRVVVESGNGMGAVTFAPIAERLRTADPGIEFIFADEMPDGRFPACRPDPLLPSYLSLLGARVLQEHADLGICFDGDADRAGFVDDQGNPIDSASVSIILFDMMATAPGAETRKLVFGNLNSSLRFQRYIESRRNEGWKFVMTPVGHGKIKELLRADAYLAEDGHTSSVLFAAEHSGHYYYPDFYSVDSAMATAILLVRKMRSVRQGGQQLSAALSALGGVCENSGEINIVVRSNQEAIDRISRVATEYITNKHHTWRGVCKTENGLQEVRHFPATTPYVETELAALDLRVDSAADDAEPWWFSVRESGNEPKLRLIVEAASHRRMTMLRDELLSTLQAE